ncbi:hypothetical protein CFC21_013300 [Triticum aestivum]|nr:uncharacterized protein LOC109735675 isoform X1 [Aegilops tauschii subsp. strangulata]XP_044451354.1 uncharacterized protein LOC123182761 isoform X1 [Triticum aestivum]KAF6997042.1 hypothetical protein CFC21_013300 [Triticum aestivum]
MASSSSFLRSPASFQPATGACGHVRWAQPLAPPKPHRSPLPPAATPGVPRRLLLPAAAGIWDFLSGGAAGAAAAPLAVRRGMQLFQQGDVAGSVAEFDRAIELDPRQKACTSLAEGAVAVLPRQVHNPMSNQAPDICNCNYPTHRWVSVFFHFRTLAYYIYRFEDAAEQFRLDVAANPNDTEESIWCFLSEAQLYGVDGARNRFLEVGLDRRPVMREAYALFKDGGDPEKLASNFSSSSGGELFYASLYAGLYYESQKDADLAKSHIVAACKTPYGSRSGDYMASLAVVHCQCRNWTLEG